MSLLVWDLNPQCPVIKTLCVKYMLIVYVYISAVETIKLSTQCVQKMNPAEQRDAT